VKLSCIALVAPLLLALFACASASDGLSRENAAAWQAAFDAGSAAYAAGDRDEAERKLREALEIAQAETPPGVRTGLALNGLAALSIDRGRYGEAEPTLERAIALLEAGGATQTLHYAAALTNAGELALREARAGDAERYFSKAAVISEAQLRSGGLPLLQRDLAGRAEALRQLGRETEAGTLAPRLAELCAQRPSPVCSHAAPR
jgi:tetratricopeptide (TPR) repeat protein